MKPVLEPLAPDERFCFACDPGVACFNRCCHDLNQFLYPYDVLRLARFLELPSGEFLARHTRLHQGPRTGLPVVSFRFDAARGQACPFVTDAGCRVYPARPAACRLYPLARAVVRNPDSGRLEAHFARVREAHCQGHDRGAHRLPSEWIRDQELERYLALNDPFIDILRVKRCDHPGPLPPALRRLIAEALYDADAFRQRVLAPRTAMPRAPTADERQQMAGDDEALLRFAYRWVIALLREGPARREEG